MLYLFLVSLIWAFSFGLIKTSLTTIPPVLVAAIRLGLSLLAFLPFFRPRALNRRTAARLFLTGMLQYGVMYICYIQAFQYLKAFEVAIFTITTPLYVTLLDDALQKRLRPANLAAAVLAVLGAAIIKWQELQSPAVLGGFLLVQASNLAFAIGQVAYRKIMTSLPRVRDSHVFAWLYLGGTAITAAASLLTVQPQQVSISTSQGLALLYLGIVASGAGFFLWNYGARRTAAGTLAVFNNLKIPLAVLVSLLFFGEQAAPLPLALGGVILIAALALAHFTSRPSPA